MSETEHYFRRPLMRCGHKDTFGPFLLNEDYANKWREEHGLKPMTIRKTYEQPEHIKLLIEELKQQE